MIGVLSSEHLKPVVEEFFQLFKTPWQYARPGVEFDVVMGEGPLPNGVAARLFLQFVPDSLAGANPSKADGPPSHLRYDGNVIPLYGPVVLFPETKARGELCEQQGRGALVRTLNQETVTVPTIQFGFNLFEEVRLLLTRGQPVSEASSPALDLHIELLRDLITGAGIPLVEIPPVPQGCLFTVCLTHDVDHPVFRRHFCDPTMTGFCYRATVGSVRDVLRGRASPAKLLRNAAAVVNAPFVYLGVRRDPWKRSLVDYAALESGLASTFFVIPFEGRPGINPNNGVSKKRAARYSLEDIGPELRTLRDAGCELGVHGIDAWADPSSGRAEFERLSKVAGSAALGVRMHWLYFNEASPKNLEEAGFQFDSTMGYNQTVGFKAGTTQPFRPLGTSRLMELPLHIMDTALFYPDYLDLDEDGARGRVAPILDHVAAQGGVLTVNWHDRSIAPERMWVPFYKWLLAELRHRGAWFATASRAVNWARARRQTTFRSVAWNGGTVRLTCDLPAESHEGLPGMRVRLHPARPNSWAQPTSTSAGRRPFVDVPLQSGELSLSA